LTVVPSAVQPVAGSSTLTSDGRRVEFVTIKDGDGPGRHVTSLRELPPEDS
jgi:hypothetical protein